MVPRTLVISIATPPRNVQGRVRSAHAEMTVVGSTVSVIAGHLHLFQLVERHEVHAIHGTGLFLIYIREDEGGNEDVEKQAWKSTVAIKSEISLP